MYIYNLGIQPVDRSNYEYQEIKGVKFSNPVHKGDFIELDGGIELEIHKIVHEVDESWLFASANLAEKSAT